WESVRCPELLRALRVCGRLNRIRPTRPRLSTMMFSLMDSSQNSFLTYRTIEGRATVLDDTLDRAAAAGSPARLVGAIVDAEMMLKHAEFPIGQPVVTQRRAAIVDRVGQH